MTSLVLDDSGAQHDISSIDRPTTHWILRSTTVKSAVQSIFHFHATESSSDDRPLCLPNRVKLEFPMRSVFPHARPNAILVGLSYISWIPEARCWLWLAVIHVAENRFRRLGRTPHTRMYTRCPTKRFSSECGNRKRHFPG